MATYLMRFSYTPRRGRSSFRTLKTAAMQRARTPNR